MLLRAAASITGSDDSLPLYQSPVMPVLNHQWSLMLVRSRFRISVPVLVGITCVIVYLNMTWYPERESSHVEQEQRQLRLEYFGCAK